MNGLSTKNKGLTQKIACISVLSVSSLLMFFLLTQPLIPLSAAVSNFFKGIFGLAFYGINIAAIAISALLLSGRKIVMRPRHVVNLALMYFSVIFLVHLVTSQLYMAGAEFSGYLADCFDFQNTPTFGGVAAGIFVFPIAKLSIVFAYIIFIAGIVLTSLFAVNIVHSKEPAVRAATEQYGPSPARSAKRDEATFKLFGKNQGAAQEPAPRSSETNPFWDWAPVTKNYDTAPTGRFDKGIEEKPVNPIFQPPGTPYTKGEAEEGGKPAQTETDPKKLYEQQRMEEARRNYDAAVAFPKVPNNAPIIDGDNYGKLKNKPAPREETPSPSLPGMDFGGGYGGEQAESGPSNPVTFGEKPFATADSSVRAFQTVVGGEKPPARQAGRAYIAPSIELLNNPPIDKEALEEDLDAKARVLEQTLAEFKIDAVVQNIIKGPAVTRYELSLAPGISIKKITILTEDIARSMLVDAVRLEPTISGKDWFGIEVPNKRLETVTLRSVIQSDAYNKPCNGLRFALGVDIGGNHIAPDLAEMPHLLIAGSTGTGKSVCLNSLIVSLMYRYSPEEMRFILVDPKRVEFTQFNGMPHLMINEVVCDTEKTITVFNWAIDEMERRYDLFADIGARNISSYNRLIDPDATSKLARIVVVVDELSDLIIYNKAEIETRIKTLSAKARAAGIHLVLATQRPSVDIITGVIKANLPSRIAFKVTSIADSKTILDQGGPERLLGKGDMLFTTGTTPKPTRLQGAFVSAGEVERVVEFIKQNNQAVFDQDAADKILSEKEADFSDEGETDHLFEQALEYVIESGIASISNVQRHFRIGFNRAGKLIDDMAQKGFVSEHVGSKARQIYISKEEFKKLYKNE